MSPPIKVFVAHRGNAFMRDIADDLVEAAEQLGRNARVVTNHLPDVDGSINLVVAPHELFVKVLVTNATFPFVPDILRFAVVASGGTGNVVPAEPVPEVCTK